MFLFYAEEIKRMTFLQLKMKIKNYYFIWFGEKLEQNNMVPNY